MTSIRYITADVEAAAGFYTERLGFEAGMVTPGFAMLHRGELRLLLNKPGAGGAGQPGNDGQPPAPGGWNRFILEVADLDALVADLRAAGCRFRTDVVQGNGGRQAVVEDPSGNAVELLEPA